MNAERLLEVLSQIGDDPARIQQLRKIAVALAITGRLDGRAISLQPDEIVEGVDRAKAILVNDGVLPKQKKHAKVTKEVPLRRGPPVR